MTCTLQKRVKTQKKSTKNTTFFVFISSLKRVCSQIGHGMFLGQFCKQKSRKKAIYLMLFSRNESISEGGARNRSTA